MAIGISTSYTPFGEVSFGYGATEIATNYTTSGDVTVTITYDAGNFDDTGHISTPVSGNAVSSFNKSNKVWTVTGTEAEVDAILAALVFYPADKPESRTYDGSTNNVGWEPITVKSNVDTGGYGSTENPPTIGATTFDIVLSHSAGTVATEVVTFTPVEPTYGSQRPFWSTEPTAEDLSSAAHDSAVGGLVDLGTIDQDTDTDNLKIICKFFDYNTSDPENAIPETTNAYGAFMTGDAFIGGSLPGTTDLADNRLNFTGTKSEVQAYLDNVRYYNMGNQTTFDMYVTITNGIVGSTFTKSVWFSDATIGVNDLTGYTFNFTEDQSVVTPAPFDFGELDITNVQDDVDEFKAIITIETAVGIAGTDTMESTSLGGGSSNYNGTTGVLTVTCDTLAKLKTALENITYTPNQDFNDDFTMSFQLSFTGPTAIGSTYTSTLQEGIVVEGEEKEDLRNQITIHNYIEESAYNFSSGIVPKITHPIDENFTVTFTMTAQAGKLAIISPTATFTDVGNGVFTLAGTRLKVNADLTNLFYKPTVDYSAEHDITFTVLRTSGGGSPPTLTGKLRMFGTDVGEFTNTQLIDVVWEEDTNLTFDNGIQIIDNADELEGELSFGTHYTVYCEMWGPGAGTVPVFSDATLKIDNTGRSITTTTAGAFVVGNQYTILTINDGLTPAGDDTDFTAIGAADNNIGTIFTATGVGDGTGTAEGDSLTITGTGQGMTNVFAISGPKADVNTAVKNIKFIPDPDYDGVGPWIWYYIKRDFDSTFITNAGALMPGPSGPQVYSYDLSLITKFLPASSTVDYFPTVVELDWEENVTKVFDSGLEINDKVTENPEYNTSPTAFYGTTYTVDAVMLVGGGSTEYTDATIDTATKGELTISGTGKSEADKFQMSGSRAEVNAALKTMKFIPNVDNVETTNTTTLWYRIKRDADYDWTTDYQSPGEPGLLHSQGSDGNGDWLNDVKTVFLTNTATPNYTSTPLTGIDWNEDEIKDFNSGIVITDKATENPDYGNLYNTTFTVTARAKYTDSGEQPMNNATWTTTWGGEDIDYSVSGVGTVADPLTITGTKADVNIALANLRMIGDLDWIDSGASDGSFWFEYQLTRDYDLSGSPYIDYGTDESEFNEGTAIAAYHSTVSPDDMAYNEDTVTKIFEGKTLGITETANDYHTDIKYQVELEIHPNADGTWGETGSSTYTSPKTTRQLINDDILTLDFRPTIDSSNNPIIKYTQRRYQNVTAGSFVVSTVYTISTLGNTTQGQWNTTAGTSGVTYTGGSTFTAATVGAGTGTADIVTVQATDVTIGTVTGTAVTPYVATVSGMTFAENVDTSIFSGKTLGITEDVSDYTSDATYTVELEISPSTHGNWDGSTSHIKTLNGTKDDVNVNIQALIVEPLADGLNVTAGAFVIGNKYTILTVGDTNFVSEQGASANTVGIVFTATAVGSGTGTATESIDFDIKYSQTRHITGESDVVQATDVNIGTAVGTDYPEFRYGTANENIQYFVTDEHFVGIDTSASEADIVAGAANVNLTPKQLTTNKGLTYERPITIVDETVGAQYKIMFSGGTLLTTYGGSLSVMDTGWQSKPDLHTIIENDVYVTNTSGAVHNQMFSANFTVHKKAYTGTETQIANGQLIYKFQTGLELWSHPVYQPIPGSWETIMITPAIKYDLTTSLPINKVYDFRVTAHNVVYAGSTRNDHHQVLWDLSYDSAGNVVSSSSSFENPHGWKDKWIYPAPNYTELFEYNSLGQQIGFSFRHKIGAPYASLVLYNQAGLWTQFQMIGSSRDVSYDTQLFWNRWGVIIRVNFE